MKPSASVSASWSEAASSASAARSTSRLASARAFSWRRGLGPFLTRCVNSSGSWLRYLGVLFALGVVCACFFAEGDVPRFEKKSTSVCGVCGDCFFVFVCCVLFFVVVFVMIFCLFWISSVFAFSFLFFFVEICRC